MATWARKATLRRGGQIARTVRVDFHLTREDVAIIVLYDQSIYGMTFDNRRALGERIEIFLRENGIPSFSHIEGIAEDQDAELAAAAIVVDRLMPELKGEK